MILILALLISNVISNGIITGAFAQTASASRPSTASTASTASTSSTPNTASPEPSSAGLPVISGSFEIATYNSSKLALDIVTQFADLTSPQVFEVKTEAPSEAARITSDVAPYGQINLFSGQNSDGTQAIKVNLNFFGAPIGGTSTLVQPYSPRDDSIVLRNGDYSSLTILK